MGGRREEEEELTHRKIGEVAELTGLSIKTIRDYDNAGLLHPSGRTSGGFRLYTDKDVERLSMIRRIKPLGFNLGEAAVLLDTVDHLDSAPEGADVSAVRARLEVFLADAEQRRRGLQDQADMAEKFLEELRDR